MYNLDLSVIFVIFGEAREKGRNWVREKVRGKKRVAAQRSGERSTAPANAPEGGKILRRSRQWRLCVGQSFCWQLVPQ